LYAGYLSGMNNMLMRVKMEVAITNMNQAGEQNGKYFD
jgi:hypothetical protein